MPVQLKGTKKWLELKDLVRLRTYTAPWWISQGDSEAEDPVQLIEARQAVQGTVSELGVSRGSNMAFAEHVDICVPK